MGFWMNISAFFRLTALLVIGLFASETAVLAQDKMRIFTHGEGTFAKLLDDGRFIGPGVDLLRCSMRALGQPFSINQAAMVRKGRLIEDGGMDAWFPSLVSGPEHRKKRIAYPIGMMPIYWYVSKQISIDPDSADFKKTAKVSAFPGSTTERILLGLDFQVQPGTDDENAVVLWLMEGRLDAFLSADFEGLLKPGARKFMDTKIKRILYKNFDVGVEFTELFLRRRPEFVQHFQKAMNACKQ